MMVSNCPPFTLLFGESLHEIMFAMSIQEHLWAGILGVFKEMVQSWDLNLTGSGNKASEFVRRCIYWEQLVKKMVFSYNWVPCNVLF